MKRTALFGSLLVAVSVCVSCSFAEERDLSLASYRIVDGGIPLPLTAQPGDPERGRQVMLDRERGDCVVCHALPLPERRSHGSIGPPLDAVGKRHRAEALRLRLVDSKALNPASIMPSYHKTAGLRRVLSLYRGKPILTAQEIEDVLAYLLTLR